MRLGKKKLSKVALPFSQTTDVRTSVLHSRRKATVVFYVVERGTDAAASKRHPNSHFPTTFSFRSLRALMSGCQTNTHAQLEATLVYILKEVSS
jgi:hypothetical protein